MFPPTLGNPDTAAWYGLRFLKNTIYIDVCREADTYLRQVLKPDIPLIADLVQGLNCGAFTQPGTSKQWGFGNGIRTADDPAQSSVIYALTLPATWSENDHAAANEAGYRASANLEVLFGALNTHTQRRDSAAPPQLLTVNLDTQRGSAGISVWLSPHVSLWVSRHPNDKEHGGVIHAMQAAYRTMWPTQTTIMADYQFGAHLRQPKWLNLTCPGDRVCLDPQSYHEDKRDWSKGYYLGTHNVYAPLQQLTLLAGIAKIHELVAQTTPAFARA